MRKRAATGGRKTAARVCPNCAMIVHKPVDRCPRCDALMATERDENVVDKAGADSFPASDPPQH
jgi:hypothetical protein